MSARYHSNIAEICEGELVDYEQVCEYWTLLICVLLPCSIEAEIFNRLKYIFF